MWDLTLSDRSFPSSPPEVIFERARRTGILRLLMHDDSLRPMQKRHLWLWRTHDAKDWQRGSQRAEALDYSRRRLHALRFERLRAGIRLTGWAIAPSPPSLEDPSLIRRYILTAAAAATFLGAQGLLLEGMDPWGIEEAMNWIRHLLPALGGLHLTLWVRLSESSLLLLEVLHQFTGAIRPWIALDLEGAPPNDFPSWWPVVAPSTSMVLVRYAPDLLEWWDREGRSMLERTGFSGELVVTFPENLGNEGEIWRSWAQAHGLLLA